MKTYDLVWTPEGRKIATVEALTARAAIKKAPMPYRRYLGEICAVEVTRDRRGKGEKMQARWSNSECFCPVASKDVRSSSLIGFDGWHIGGWGEWEGGYKAVVYERKKVRQYERQQFTTEAEAVAFVEAGI